MVVLQLLHTTDTVFRMIELPVRANWGGIPNCEFEFENQGLKIELQSKLFCFKVKLRTQNEPPAIGHNER
jgi:hypothetical protein